MKDKILNFLRVAIAIILMAIIMFGVFLFVAITYETDSIESQAYSNNHECVKFISYVEDDEFGESRLTRIYHYSDGHVITDHEYNWARCY